MFTTDYTDSHRFKVIRDITDYDAYFVGCYKKAALVKIKRENRYAHPEDDFFLRCGDRKSVV